MDTKLILTVGFFAAIIGFIVYRVIEGLIEKNNEKKWRRAHQSK